MTDDVTEAVVVEVADESVAGAESLELTDKVLGDIIGTEIERIRKEKGTVSGVTDNVRRTDTQ